MLTQSGVVEFYPYWRAKVEQHYRPVGGCRRACKATLASTLTSVCDTYIVLVGLFARSYSYILAPNETIEDSLWDHYDVWLGADVNYAIVTLSLLVLPFSCWNDFSQSVELKKKRRDHHQFAVQLFNHPDQSRYKRFETYWRYRTDQITADYRFWAAGTFTEDKALGRAARNKVIPELNIADPENSLTHDSIKSFVKAFLMVDQNPNRNKEEQPSGLSKLLAVVEVCERLRLEMIEEPGKRQKASCHNCSPFVMPILSLLARLFAAVLAIDFIRVSAGYYKGPPPCTEVYISAENATVLECGTDFSLMLNIAVFSGVSVLLSLLHHNISLSEGREIDKSTESYRRFLGQEIYMGQAISSQPFGVS